MALNANAGSQRRFILVEQGRPEKGDPYARGLTSDRLQRVASGNWARGKVEPLHGGFEFRQLGKAVDGATLLAMERDEMVDTVISSHFDVNRRRGDSLQRVTGPYRHLVAHNASGEGFFLVWDGPDGNCDITEAVYEEIAVEAEQAGLKSSIYHIYARLYRYQTDGVRFYQIPDRILQDFGLDIRSEPFADPTDDA